MGVKISLQKRIHVLIASEPGITAPQIALRLDCRQEYVRVCMQRGRVMVAKRAVWTADEIAQLYDLRDNRKMDWSEIAEVTGKTVSALHSKYSYAQSAMLRHQVSSVNIVPSDREMDRRYRQSLEPRDLTAGFCGDPLPGYSALERRA